MPRTGRPPKPAKERFIRLMKPKSPNGCIEWGGGIDRHGYGQFRPAGGRASSKAGAHRCAYIYFVGPIPPGLQIDHLCRNRACVNPDHLEVVTLQENIRRRDEWRRKSKKEAA